VADKERRKQSSNRMRATSPIVRASIVNLAKHNEVSQQLAHSLSAAMFIPSLQKIESYRVMLLSVTIAHYFL